MADLRIIKLDLRIIRLSIAKGREFEKYYINYGQKQGFREVLYQIWPKSRGFEKIRYGKKQGF